MSEDSKEQQPSVKKEVEDEKDDSFLGFSVVDDVSTKEGDVTGSGEETSQPDGSPKKDTTAREAPKVDGDGDRKLIVVVKKLEDEVAKQAEKTVPAEKAGTKKTTAPAVTTTSSDTNGPDATVKKKTEPTTNSTSEGKDDALLITAEEDIDVADNKETTSTATTTTTDQKDTKEKAVTNGNAGKSKPKGSPTMWVSNIARRIKATDLKKAFSKHGRVVTAKIVTNGKSYFGYICMDSSKSVERCIKHLNDTKLGDKKITISTTRPDGPKRAKAADTKTPASSKKDDKPKTSEVKDTAKETEKKSADSKVSSTKKKEDAPKEKARQPVRRLDTDKEEIIRLKRELRSLRGENDVLRRRMLDAQKRLHDREMMAKRYARMLKDSEKRQQDEKLRFDKERDSLLKKNRMEMSRLDAERDIIEKDRMELKRRREDLEHDMRKLVDMQRAVERSQRSARKSRSVSPRVSSSGKRARDTDMKYDQLPSKKPRWSGDRADRVDRVARVDRVERVVGRVDRVERDRLDRVDRVDRVDRPQRDRLDRVPRVVDHVRTPPPPPKLSAAVEPRRKGDPERFYDNSNRVLRRETAVYVPPGEYPAGRDNRHGRAIPAETKSAVVVPSRSAMWSEPNNVAPSSNHWRPGAGGDVPGGQYAEGGSRYREQPFRSSTGTYPGERREEVRAYARSSDPQYRRTGSGHYEPAPRKY